LVTDSRELITAVQRELDIQVANTSNIDRVKVALAGVQSALVLVPDLEIAVAVSNEYATEHLEIQTANPQALLPKITNAGAIFLGEYSPVSLGDYLAGSNHVLPTGEQAKFGPGLGVHTFLRPQQIINYSRSALESVVNQLDTFAIAEGLSAHGDAAKIRFTGGN
jgi:histidinol dehydrogenase